MPLSLRFNQNPKLKYVAMPARLVMAAAVTALLASSASAAPIKTLFLGYDWGVDATMADILGSDTRFDLSGSTANSACDGSAAPSLATLQQYSSVLVWANCGPASGLGNVLADYADQGGRVVLSTFLGYYDSFGGFGGRITSHGYNPFTGGTTDAYHSVTLGSHDSGNALFNGVNAVSSSYYNGDWLALDSGATLLASWSDGRPFVGVNAAGNVLNVSLFPNVAIHGHASGDYAQLFRNALAYGGPQQNTNAQALPEPSSMMLVALAGLALVAGRRRSKHLGREVGQP